MDMKCDKSDSKQSKERRKAKKRAKDVKNTRKRNLMEDNADEDKMINKLEKALKLNKRKKKKIASMFVDDGLDFVLEVLGKTEHGPQDSDYFDDELLNEDLAVATGIGHSSNGKRKLLADDEKQNRKKQLEVKKPRRLADLLREKEGTVEEIDDDEESNFSGSDSEDIDQSNESDNSSDEVNPDEISNDNIDDLNLNEAGDHPPDSSNPTLPKLREDIYGRLRDEAGNVVEDQSFKSVAYIPPGKRSQTENVDANKKAGLLRIQRQLKGLLNRLSESNMRPICSQIEDMYMKNSRNDMNETLMFLMTELVLSPVLTPPRLIMEQAMLVALLHANVGSEVGAYFLQCLATKLDQLLKSGGNYGQGKECNNVLIFLSHLYNCKVTSCSLMFDILQCLVDSFQDKDIELIQLLLKSVGFCLRKDDPSKLKEIVHSIQIKAPTFKGGENSSRVQFMLETLTAIRNNNMYKIPDYDPSIVEHMKKAVRNLQRQGVSSQELVISFEDLLKAEERGRWWIIGSAWSERHDQKETSTNSTDSIQFLPKVGISEKILELARKQHMNTEIRKTIFCIIMTAEDYMDAFEKLLHLNLKNQQEREIINVILHCSLQEKNYNPYYAYLAGKFCNFERKHYMTLQFSLWDKFKELEKLKSYQVNCLAQFLTHLFTTGALPISVLKVIHFSDMNKVMMRFFRQILLAILLHDSEEVCCQVFKRIAPANNLNLLREGLRLFMHHFLLRNTATFEASVAEKLTERVKLAESALNSSKHAFKL